jgi:twitching motility protein PilJ
VATGTQQQANSVTQVLNLSEQVEQSARAAAEQVQTTHQSLLSLSQAVNQGQQAIAKLIQGIDVLEQGSNRIVQQMKTLGEFVGLADQFVHSQSDIAQQTQVLALNAALVAARAAGQRNPRTFAVVAREFEGIAEQVGNLAQQTNQGLAALEQRTSQIHTVVSAIDAEVQNLGGVVGEFSQGVQQAGALFNNAQTVTAESILSGEAVARSSQEILGATVATATAMRDIANLAQQTTQLTSNSLSQSEAMGELSKQLLHKIGFFQLPETAITDIL